MLGRLLGLFRRGRRGGGSSGALELDIDVDPEDRPEPLELFGWLTAIGATVISKHAVRLGLDSDFVESCMASRRCIRALVDMVLTCVRRDCVV